MEALIIIGSILVIVLWYFVAKWFYEAAEEKGFDDRKYFWICFLLGFIGILLVIALPDRGNSPVIVANDLANDELPDL